MSLLFLPIELLPVIREHIKKTGPVASDVHDEGRLDSVLNAPVSYSCYNPTADIYDVAAHYTFYIATGHVYEDGNKRTALFVTILFLALNLIWLNDLFEELGPIIESLVKREISVEELSAIYRKNGTPLPKLAELKD